MFPSFSLFSVRWYFKEVHISSHENNVVINKSDLYLLFRGIICNTKILSNVTYLILGIRFKDLKWNIRPLKEWYMLSVLFSMQLSSIPFWRDATSYFQSYKTVQYAEVFHDRIQGYLTLSRGGPAVSDSDKDNKGISNYYNAVKSGLIFYRNVEAPSLPPRSIYYYETKIIQKSNCDHITAERL